ncbi:MAG TPA: helix-turn-helix domain-containing protein [Gemmatimonadaceae bacterium]
MASLTLDWIQLTQVVGALQGFLLTCVLLTRRKNRTAHRLLAALMAAFTIYLATGPYYSAGVVRSFPHFFGFGYQMPWVFGPLVYLYAVAASDRSWRFRKETLLHFVPVTINVLATLPYYLMSGAEKVAMLDRWLAGEVPRQLALLDPFKYVLGLSYSIATIVFLRRHRRLVENSYSNTERVNLRWLLFLTMSAFGIWLLATTLKVAEVQTGVRDEHISLAMAALVYAIGYMGLRQPEVFRYETAEYPIPTLTNAVPPSPPSPPDESKAVESRYERSGLGDAEAQLLKTTLLAVMDAKRPWRDSELTLADLATLLDTTPHKLSEVLNSEIGQTFYDFVNGYRVREVQRRIKAGEARALKMLALAMDAGFASKSTFNEAFKKHTSQTPSGFRQAVGA